MSQGKGIQEKIKTIENLIQNLKEQGEEAGLSQEQIQTSIASMASQRIRLLAQLEGSGAIAQNNSTAIGKQGVGVGGDAKESIIATGDKNRIVKTDTYVERQFMGESDPTDPTALREAYLRRTIECTSELSLTGIDPKSASESKAQLSLSSVYLPRC